MLYQLRRSRLVTLGDAQSRLSTGYPFVGRPAKYNTHGEYAGRDSLVLSRDQPPGFGRAASTGIIMPGKEPGRLAKFVGGIIGLMLLYPIVACVQRKPTATENAIEETKKLVSDRHSQCITAVANRLERPQSIRDFSDVVTTTNERGNTVDVFKFKARNAFGEMVAGMGGCEWRNEDDLSYTLLKSEVF